MREEEEEEEEEEPNWFARWEEQLPTPEELMPLSQTLITPGLALAFDIPTATPAGVGSPPLASNHSRHHHHHHPHLLQPQSSSVPGSDFDSSDLNSASAAAGNAGAGGSGDEPARTLKRPRLVWTPQLHKRFVDAVAHLGIKNAVPKTIMQLMSVDGLTRENVASHLQKYRLYLKRMQGLTASGGGAGAGGPISGADAATDQLFASSPVPHHFLAPGAVGGTGGPAEPFLPFVPVTALQHHQQINAAAAMQQQQQQQQQQQFYHQRHMGHYGSPTNAAGGGFDHGFLGRAVQQPGLHRMTGPAPGTGLGGRPPLAGSYVDEVESGGRGGGGYGNRKVLTLFPTGED